MRTQGVRAVYKTFIINLNLGFISHSEQGFGSLTWVSQKTSGTTDLWNCFVLNLNSSLSLCCSAGVTTVTELTQWWKFVGFFSTRSPCLHQMVSEFQPQDCGSWATSAPTVCVYLANVLMILNMCIVCWSTFINAWKIHEIYEVEKGPHPSHIPVGFIRSQVLDGWCGKETEADELTAEHKSTEWCRQ